MKDIYIYIYIYIYIRPRALREGRARVFYFCSPTLLIRLSRRFPYLVYIGPPPIRTGARRICTDKSRPPPGPPWASPDLSLGPRDPLGASSASPRFAQRSLGAPPGTPRAAPRAPRDAHDVNRDAKAPQCFPRSAQVLEIQQKPMVFQRF